MKKKNNNIDYKSISQNTTQIITILTFLSAVITAIMTASHFIADYIVLTRYSIWSKSIINIEMLEITANLFIAVLVVILLSLCLCVKKYSKKKQSKFILIALLIMLSSTLLCYQTFFQNPITIIIVILINTIIFTIIIYTMETNNIIGEVVSLAISIIISLIIAPIISAFFTSSNDLILVKEKNNSTKEFNKAIIYQTYDKAILCNYTINKNNEIIPNCETYEIVNNEDLIFKSK